MDNPIFDKLIDDLCNVAGYSKNNVLVGVNMPAIHQRYFLYRYLLEEKEIKYLKTRWPGLDFSHHYKILRKRISPMLERKYQETKKQFDKI